MDHFSPRLTPWAPLPPRCGWWLARPLSESHLRPPSKGQSNYSIHPLVFLLFVRWHRLSVIVSAQLRTFVVEHSPRCSGTLRPASSSATTLKVRASAFDHDRLRGTRKP